MKGILAFTLALIFASTVNAQDRGLHNSSKSFVDPPQITRSDWVDPNEMHRTWMAAIVRVPTGNSRSKRIKASQLANWRPRFDGKLPAVVYLHGCSGIWPGTHARIKFMADLGFVVIGPASFARKKYAQSCDTKTNNGDMYRDVVQIRKNDAVYAIRQVRKLPFIAADRVIVMGLSQGGVTTAMLPPQPGEAARIIEGWTCHAGWQEYKGLKANASTPVLALVGTQDPWFQTKWLKGHCGRFMRANNGSRSLVYNSGSLAREHELLDHRGPRQEVVRFLKDQGLIK